LADEDFEGVASATFPHHHIKLDNISGGDGDDAAAVVVAGAGMVTELGW